MTGNPIIMNLRRALFKYKPSNAIKIRLVQDAVLSSTLSKIIRRIK